MFQKELRNWSARAVRFVEVIKDIFLISSLLDTFVLALNCIINVHNFNSLCSEIKKALLKQKGTKVCFPNCYNLQVLILKLWIVL